MEEADVIIVGAGAVGLACAAALAKAGRDVVVIERGSAIGGEISSRNSEVVHAGIYYATGSLKHRLCVEGRRLLYPYLESRSVAHRVCGKLIVATSDAEIAEIEKLSLRGEANGVEDLSLLDAESALKLEPSLRCKAALLSAQTGIMDSHAYMLALLGEIEDCGGVIAFETPILAIEPQQDGAFIVIAGGAEQVRFRTRAVVNAAGLGAHDLARRIEGLDAAYIPDLSLAKGSYFACLAKPAFSHLIYPAPVEGGLGVHVTLDLAGRMRFGPDVEWLDHSDPGSVDYRVDASRADGFYEAVRKYWPGLPDGSIAPDYAGCRPKLSGKGEPAADFRIDGPEVHGVAGLVNLFGIESPGLTSSLAIARTVATRLM